MEEPTGEQLEREDALGFVGACFARDAFVSCVASVAAIETDPKKVAGQMWKNYKRGDTTVTLVFRAKDGGE